jgi:signal transduction histidine kinase
VTAPAAGAPGRPCGPHGRGHRRLFWRVYLHGVLLLVAVGLAVGAVGWALHASGSFGQQPGRVAGYAAGRLAELAPSPERLGAELARIREVFGIQATVYDPAGAVLATNVEPPLAPPRAGAPVSGGPVRLRGRGYAWAAPLPGVGGLVVLSHPNPDSGPARGLLFIGAVLFALALASWPLARSIASPVERITAAARALGEGQLDARARVTARGELGELGRTFDEMAARLQALISAERELLANVSHELRTPLARIRVALELAAEGDAARARRALAEIGEDLGELDRLVGDVLEAARLDAKGAAALRVEARALDAAALAGEAAERFRAAHPDRTLALEVEGPLPPLRGDPALLRRLLGNLLENAAKYSDAAAPVTLAARRGEGGAVVLEVRDRGIGIAAEDLPRLFTPFFRTDRSRARGTGGTGLGLALAKRIAEAHGGAIAARSAPGEGTAFSVTVPPAG